VLDGAPWAAQAGLFLARERGYFAEGGVDMHFDVAESREAALQRLSAGRADLAVVGGLDLLRARGEGAPVVSIFAITPRPLVALITVKEGGPARPRDLAGRTIAMPADRMGRVVVEETLRGDGLDPGKVVTAPPGDDPVGGLAARRLDGLGGYGPREGAALDARGVAANRLLPTAFGVPDYYELVVATTDATRQSRVDALRGFAAAAQRGYAEAARSPEGAVETLGRASPSLDRTLASRTTGELAADWRAGTIGEQLEPRWRASAAFLARLGLVRPDLDANSTFTNELLPKPSPAAAGSVTPTPSGPTATPIPRPGAPAPPAAPGRVPTVIRIAP
jgi:putative hydroxymethylpyrimidine transport system substrate-binding protein